MRAKAADAKAADAEDADEDETPADKPPAKPGFSFSNTVVKDDDQ
jgi:hypothetical protein